MKNGAESAINTETVLYLSGFYIAYSPLFNTMCPDASGAWVGCAIMHDKLTTFIHFSGSFCRTD